MQRTRVNGNTFQSDIEKAAEKLEQPIFVMRLRTPQARQANVRNIADFVLFGRAATILEVKETKANAFSLNTFQQKEEVGKFQVFFEKAKVYYDFEFGRPYRVAVLVHFITQGKYSLYYLEDNPFIVMHPDDKNCITWTSLSVAIEYIVTH